MASEAKTSSRSVIDCNCALEPRQSSEVSMSVEQTNSDPAEALYRAENTAAALAEKCRELCDIQGWAAETGLEQVVNFLMTELWDRNFSQTEIRHAFNAAVADMNRYAAGDERRAPMH